MLLKQIYFFLYFYRMNLVFRMKKKLLEPSDIKIKMTIISFVLFLPIQKMGFLDSLVSPESYLNVFRMGIKASLYAFGVPSFSKYLQWVSIVLGLCKYFFNTNSKSINVRWRSYFYTTN